MNFEQPTITQENIMQEKPELPPELIAMVEKGISDASKAQESFNRVAKAMVIRGIGDDQEAYLKILAAMARLKRDELELKKDLNKFS